MLRLRRLTDHQFFQVHEVPAVPDTDSTRLRYCTCWLG